MSTCLVDSDCEIMFGPGWRCIGGVCTPPPEPEPEPPEPEPEPPEPEPEEDRFIETYRGVGIWWKPAISAYWAQVQPGYVATSTTRTGCRAEIDEILEFLEPPEEPPEGLFAQVVAAVKAWFIANLPDWVLKWGKVINNWITNVTENITNVVNNITEKITNVYNTVKEYVTNVYNYVTEKIYNTIQNITKNITNVYNTTKQYITNVVGASTEWVNDRIAGVRTYVDNAVAGIDTVGFFKDPLGYIGTAFNKLIGSWVHGIVKSFWEGFEEGLEAPED